MHSIFALLQKWIQYKRKFFLTFGSFFIFTSDRDWYVILEFYIGVNFLWLLVTNRIVSTQLSVSLRMTNDMVSVTLTRRISQFFHKNSFNSRNDDTNKFPENCILGNIFCGIQTTNDVSCNRICFIVKHTENPTEISWWLGKTTGNDFLKWIENMEIFNHRKKLYSIYSYYISLLFFLLPSRLLPCLLVICSLYYFEFLYYLLR